MKSTRVQFNPYLTCVLELNTGNVKSTRVQFAQDTGGEWQHVTELGECEVRVKVSRLVVSFMPTSSAIALQSFALVICVAMSVQNHAMRNYTRSKLQSRAACLLQTHFFHPSL